MVKGLEVFAEFFAAYKEQYVLIGGVATILALEDAGLDARATRDLDIVLCVEALTPDFGARMWAFIQQGGYAVREVGEEPRRFYRFQKPTDPAYPAMLEFFAREPGFAPLAEGADLTPVPIDEAVVSLSAILLDNDYYQFIHENKRVLSDVHVVNENCLIPLKARAWLDLSERKAKGESVDEKDIRKHRNDVLRLAQLLTEDIRVELPKSIAADMQRFVDKLAAELDPAQLKSLGLKGGAPEQILGLLRNGFLPQATINAPLPPQGISMS